MKSLQIKNFRTIIDSGEIELKPITVLVGKNSCGKSTLIRILPLLKQSTESYLSGPLALNDRLVDFGDIEDVKNLSQKDQPISINMVFKYIYSRFEAPVDYEVSLNIEGKGVKNYLSQITMKLLGHKIVFDMHEEKLNKITINKTEFDVSNHDIICSYSNRIIPKMIYKDIDVFSPLIIHLDSLRSNDIHNPIKETCVNFLQSLRSRSSYKSTIKKFLDKFSIGKRESIIEKLKYNSSILGLVFSRNLSKMSSDELNKMCDIIILDNLIYLYNNLLDQIRMTFSHVYYVGPIRSIAERYYRLQNKNVSELESDGSNLAMFLDSLSRKDLKSLNKFLKDNLNFTIKSTTKQGFNTIMIDNNMGLLSNIVDVGFGYSQILPIVVNIWLIMHRSSERKGNFFYKESNKYFFIVEQPELHLHPEFQAKLMDTYVKVVKSLRNNDIDIKFLIETHSEAMVTRLGYNVIMDNIETSDISTLVFEKTGEMISSIKKGTFDEDGFLQNWPIGFFEPKMEV